MRLLEQVIEIASIIDIFEKGVTEPLYCIDMYGAEAVVKFQNNRYGTQVLLNELIGNYVADSLGVLVPVYGVCKIDKSTADRDRFAEYNYAEDDFLGYGFYSKYVPNTTPIKELPFSMVERCDVNRIILLDQILNNEDRHEGNLRLAFGRIPELYAIDYSHIIAKDIPWSEKRKNEIFATPAYYNKKILSENQDVYDILFRHRTFSRDGLRKEAERIKRIFQKIDFSPLKKTLPLEWLKEVDSDMIENILMYIQNRVNCIEDICEMIIAERS